MTYLFKLARRLAFAPVAAVASIALLACSEPESRDFLGTEPGTPTSSSLPVSLHIAQHPGSVAHNEYMRFAAWGRNGAGDSIAVHVSWTASAGEIGPDGTFRATAAGQQVITAFATSRPSVKASTSVVVGDPGSIFTGLRVIPEPVAVYGGGTVNFAATAKLSETGATTAPAVTWSTNGGSITPQGAFVATSVPGQYQVTAVTADGKLTGMAKVTVKDAELLKVRVLPKAAVIPGGGTQEFSVSANWSDGSTVVPVLEWQSEAGTFAPLAAMQAAPGGNGNGNGNGSGGGGTKLTGGTTPGNYKVIAKHPHSGQSDTALVTILPTLAEIQLFPGSLSLVSGASATFSVAGIMTDGSSVTVPVSWKATGGQISNAGVYLAGPQAGSYQVIATAEGGVADTAAVQITQPVATLSSLTIQPGGGTVGTSAIVQFAAQGTWSDGSTAQPSVSWFADGGSITPDGRWTAPASAGTFRVRVVQSGGTKADTAVMTVEQAAPTLATLSITPENSAMTGGQSVTFTPAATWSNGGTSVPPLTWSATGGTMGQDGKWKAPANYPGTYKVVAKHSAGTLADTATVQVSELPHVTRISVSPSVAAVVAKGTVQFAGAATWSDGQQRSVDFIWQATGGSINMQGLFTAGSLAGQFMVIATCTGCAVTDTVGVTISDAVETPPPSLTQLVLNPSSFTVEPGKTRSLSLAATWSDGSTTVPTVSWDATGGTVAGLVYTAGNTAGTYRIIVRHQGGTLADTSAVTVGAGAAATLQSLAITPDPASVTAGYSLGFTVTGSMSDGTTTTPSVSWSATGGTISSSGIFTAGSSTGTFQVSAADAASGLSAQVAVVVTAPVSSIVNQPELPRHQVNISYPALTGKTIHVASGGNLQGAINGAACGDEIVLAAGAVFTGSFSLPNKGCTSYIVIRGSGPTPAAGTRVSPATAAGFPKLMAPGSNQSPIIAAPGAGYYRLVGLEVSAAPSAGALNALVRLHVDQLTSITQLPHHIVLDRMYIHGHPTMSLTRCVLMNSAATAVIDSYLDDCHTKGSDSQAIVGWTGTGPYLIQNNYLAGAGENVMFGGSDPSITGLVPSDITIRRNHFHKPLSWKGVWTVKNILELKNAERVLVEDNIFENNWPDAQAGAALLFKSTNQGGSAPWSRVTDVTFRYNLVRNSLSGLNLAADPQGTVVPTARISLEHNIFEQIGSTSGGSAGYLFQLLGNSEGLADVQIRHTTATLDVNTNHLIGLEGAMSRRFVFVDNFVNLGAYGVKGSGVARGTPSLLAYFDPYLFAGNAIVGPSSLAEVYPAGNNWVTSSALTAALTGSATDGTNPGADTSTVLARLVGVRSF